MSNKMIHKVSYWAQGSGFDDYGNPSYDAPVIVDARWEDKNRFFSGQDGQQKTSSAEVLVDREMQIGDYLLFGESTDATPPSSARQIKSFRRIENVLGTKVDYLAVM